MEPMQESCTLPVVERPAVTRDKWRFREILALPEVGARFERVRQWFHLRESTYDITNRCNLRCEGCYYYEGEKQFTAETPDPAAWRRLMEAERARGIDLIAPPREGAGRGGDGPPDGVDRRRSAVR